MQSKAATPVSPVLDEPSASLSPVRAEPNEAVASILLDISAQIGSSNAELLFAGFYHQPEVVKVGSLQVWDADRKKWLSFMFKLSKTALKWYREEVREFYQDDIVSHCHPLSHGFCRLYSTFILVTHTKSFDLCVFQQVERWRLDRNENNNDNVIDVDIPMHPEYGRVDPHSLFMISSTEPPVRSRVVLLAPSPQDKDAWMEALLRVIRFNFMAHLSFSPAPSCLLFSVIKEAPLKLAGD